MSDPINGGGGPGKIGGAGLGDAAVGDVQGAGFDQALSEVGTAGGVGGASAASPEALDNAVMEVAGKIQRGEISGPAEALEEVIGAMVDVQFQALPPSMRAEMSQDLKAEILEDPFLVLEIEEMLQDALMSL